MTSSRAPIIHTINTAGRERTLRDQALALLDRQKDVVLEFVSMQIEPALMATVAGKSDLY